MIKEYWKFKWKKFESLKELCTFVRTQPSQNWMESFQQADWVNHRLWDGSNEGSPSSRHSGPGISAQSSLRARKKKSNVETQCSTKQREQPVTNPKEGMRPKVSQLSLHTLSPTPNPTLCTWALVIPAPLPTTITISYVEGRGQSKGLTHYLNGKWQVGRSLSFYKNAPFSVWTFTTLK